MSAWMNFLTPNRAQAMTLKQEPMMTPVQPQVQPTATPDWSGPINSSQNKAFLDKYVGQPAQGLWNKVSSVDWNAPIQDVISGKAISQPQAKPAPTPVGKPIGMTQKPLAQASQQQPDQMSQSLSMSQSTRGPASVESMGVAPQGNYQQQIEAALMDSIKKQQANAQTAQDEYDQLGKQPQGLGQVDWSPMLALTDQWNNTNLTSAYKQPTGKADWEKKKATLRGALEKADGTVTESQLAYLKMKADEARADENADLRRMMYGQQMGNTMEKEVRDMRENVEPLQDVLNSIGEVEKTLNVQFENYDEKTGTHNGKPVNVPGTHIPGLGTYTFYDQNARDLDAKISSIFNKTLLTRSGATVSNREMENLRVEFMSGRFNTPQEKLKALKQYEAASKRAMQNVEAAYRQPVKGTYQQRGGQTLNQFGPQGGQQSSAPQGPNGLMSFEQFMATQKR